MATVVIVGLLTFGRRFVVVVLDIVVITKALVGVKLSSTVAFTFAFVLDLDLATLGWFTKPLPTSMCGYV